MIFCNLPFILEEKKIRPFPLSKELNLPRSFINSLVENTFQTLNIESIDKLCTYFKITYEDLFAFYPIFLNFDHTESTITMTVSMPSHCDVEIYNEHDDLELSAKSFSESFRFSYEYSDIDTIEVDILDDDYEKWGAYLFDAPSLTSPLKDNYLWTIEFQLEKYTYSLDPLVTDVHVHHRITSDERTYDDDTQINKLLARRRKIDEELKELGYDLNKL